MSEPTLDDLPKDMALSDDRLLPSILIRGMDSGLRLRDERFAAEAEQRRLQHELALCTERVETVRERYKANESLVRDVWETLKKGWLAQPHPAAQPAEPEEKAEP